MPKNGKTQGILCLKMVSGGGLEPPRIAPLAPQASVSANSTTQTFKLFLRSQISNLSENNSNIRHFFRFANQMAAILIGHTVFWQPRQDSNLN